MDKAKAHLRANWKRYALLAIGAGAAYYGVPPEVAQEAAIKVYETILPRVLGQ
jgi:hypothetical protein